jgi:acyl-CoA synthetase (AMP-forming)/AMP-acid ligase II
VQIHTETLLPARDRQIVAAQPDSLPARIAAVARTHPDRPCLVDGAAQERRGLSFGETWRAIGNAAERLRRAGVGPADKVAVLSPNDLRVVVSTVAVLSLGAAWLPINSRESSATIVALLDRFDCDVLVVHPDLAELANTAQREVPGLRGVLSLDDLTDSATELPELAPRVRDLDPADQEIAAIFPTGGTTGRPKGVTFTHRRLTALAECYASVLARPGDVYLAAAPLTHVGGRICLSVIASGGTVVVLPGFDERAVLKAVQRHGVTTLTVTSTMLYRLLDCPERPRFDTSSLRSLVYGGGPTAVSRIRQAIEVFGPILEGGYGQTEAPMFITRFRPEDHVVDGRPAPDERLRSVGRATAVSEVRIVDDEGRVVPPGTSGRVLVRGPFTMDGYYRDTEATAARRVGGFHSTGDVGFLDDDGFLTLVGRETDLIITGGFNVYPAEVENVVAAQPGVRECAVFGLPDDRWGEVVVAVVSAEAGVRLDPDELRGQVRSLLGGVKTPKRIEVVEELPRNDTGKILKRVLVEERGT